MRFMIIVKANADSEAGVLPNEAELLEMGKFNEELIKSGIMLAGEGLQASSKGARLRLENGKRTVIDGPFAEAKELIAGFWMVQAKSKAEVIELFKRCPASAGEIEIRQVFDSADFEPVIKTDAGRELLEREDEFRRTHGQ
ncbi:MAG: YciI family protein [Gemmatimonadales bacterium]